MHLYPQPAQFENDILDLGVEGVKDLDLVQREDLMLFGMDQVSPPVHAFALLSLLACAAA